MSFFNSQGIRTEIGLIGTFLKVQGKFWQKMLGFFLGWTGFLKVEMVKLMYQRRGRFSQSFMNIGMAMMAFLAVMLSGQVEEMIINRGNKSSGSNYLMAGVNAVGARTIISNSQKGDITDYRVEDGDTVASIAQKFGISMDTILWENALTSVESIKVGQILRILPITGIRYKTKRGDTIYIIAKRYQVDAQVIADYVFNSFENDETFALAVGQDLMIPDGIKPDAVVVDTQVYAIKKVAPIPGVVGEGNFMWPTSGGITQRYSWYHRATDIANRDNPPVVAAQSGSVILAGWSGGGYGNYVVIDHGNGFETLYGHLLNNSIVIKAGDKVSQGQKLGTMGSTGRSTGTHLHFEIKKNGGNIDPLGVLK